MHEAIAYVETTFGSHAAEGVLDRLLGAFETLAANPGIGRRRADITQDEGIRFWPVGPALIAYRNTEATLEILFIERGEKDWPNLFDT